MYRESKTFSIKRLANGLFEDSEARLAVERELPIYVNGECIAVASVTPSMEKEFVAGYLFGQGFIRSKEDIASLEITDGGAAVDLSGINIFRSGRKKMSYRIVSGGGSTVYADPPLPCRRISSHFRIAERDIFNAMNMLFDKAVLYRETGGVHTAALFDEGNKPVCVSADIGRHNTVDKIVGYTLLHNIECAGTFIVSTGRMTSEMVLKIGRAGIPLAATKTAVTDVGIRIAGEYGLTLIGFVRDAGSKMYTDMTLKVFNKAEMRIYTGAERVL